MDKRKMQLILGALLHDIGKVVYTNKEEDYRLSGYNFIKDQVGLKDGEILDQLTYHHEDDLANVKIKNNSLAYITYIADKIGRLANGNPIKDKQAENYIRGRVLESIFNNFKGNRQKYFYKPRKLQEEINYPVKKKPAYEVDFYEQVKADIKDLMVDFDYQKDLIGSLLDCLELYLTYIPATTNEDGHMDISLYDHIKIRTAIASCIYDYMEDNAISDYRAYLYENEEGFCQEEVFMLFSMDISGIQDFIYTFIPKGALKSFRARSFYLEILIENIIDDLLEHLALSRANLLYSGGGHAYILLANTKETKLKVKDFVGQINTWFLQVFGTSLYMAYGYSSASANTFANKGEKKYVDSYRECAEMIGENKLNRYTARDINLLNSKENRSGKKECQVCKREDKLLESDKCSICSGLENMSNSILHDKYFIVLTRRSSAYDLPLPFNRYLTSNSDKKLLLMQEGSKDKTFLRIYSKNDTSRGRKIHTRIWVGDYNQEKTLTDQAEKAEGIMRIGGLRADIDDLGKTFSKGFSDELNTISRSSSLSRNLSLFFKYHINHILASSEFSLGQDEQKARRNVSIIYSGGDDLFIVGSWDDLIGGVIDINRALGKFSQNMLTISAGIGVYMTKYPISAIASEVGELEQISKSVTDKNSLSLFNKEHTYKWENFISNVMGEKLYRIREFFNHIEEDSQRGRIVLYKLIELISEKDQTERLNIARMAYLLARLKPANIRNKKENKRLQENYKDFSRDIYRWVQERESRQELLTAIYIYIYLTR